MATIDQSDFGVVLLPDPAPQRRTVPVVVVTSVALSFISFWRAAAIVLNDLASTCYYIGGISEQAVGKAAPWFVLAVMLFSYAVRAVYVESCTLFTRGGVYRVVKEAMGGHLAKLSVSALMFDYILTGPISAVSAGQYLVGLAGNLLALPPLGVQFDASTHPQLVRLASMLVAVAITLYFWRTNLIGIGESSKKALRIMQFTTVMGVLVVGWCLLTLALRPETRHLPPLAPVLTPESSGWLAGVPRLVGLLGVAIAFGHSLLAMSGEESLAQVYREVEAPKLRNLKKAGLVIFLYSLLLTSLVSFFAVMIIPDGERIRTRVVEGGAATEVASVEARAGRRVATRDDGTTFTLPPGATVVRESGRYTDNLISGLVMHTVGPRPLKLAFQAFVVFVGFLILSGAVNTSIVGSNGVLNRLAEDGILTPWFLHPQPRYGTTHRLINAVAVLQLLTILASRGDVYTLGEAYAFGVVWSFVFKTLAMVVLRFKDKSPREYEVPLNVRVATRRGRIDLPVGITAIFLVLLSTALLNLLTKKVATVWGVGFTAAFLALFVACERLSRRWRNGRRHEHLEQFNEAVTGAATPASLGLSHPSPVLVAIRNPNSMRALRRVLDVTDTAAQDVVAVTCKVLPPLTQGVTPEEMSVSELDREVLTGVVNAAEEAGKRVFPLVVPTNNPLYAVACAARDLGAAEVVLGASAKVTPDVQLEQFALAWGMATAELPAPPPLSVRVAAATGEVRHDL
jgi:amino acid transporter